MLTADQIVQFNEHGWLAPIDIMSVEDAGAVLMQLEQAEEEYPEQLNAENRNNAHLALPFLAELTTNKRIVDCAAALVGPDIALWSTVLFIKEPHSDSFVSWHQDARYMAVAPDVHVTAWLALTASTVESGCVSVLPGTHRDGAVDHVDTFAGDNILTRGQQVEGVDESTVVHLELQPGQMSLHHPWLVHGSQPNTSDERRVGIAMQSYLGAAMRPTRGIHYVTHVRGQANANGFRYLDLPKDTFTLQGNANRATANEAFADVLYDGASERRRF